MPNKRKQLETTKMENDAKQHEYTMPSKNGQLQKWNNRGMKQKETRNKHGQTNNNTEQSKQNETEL